MYIPITAVALRTVQHNDRTSVLTAWSPQHGRISLAMPNGNTTESRRRRALTMPLSLFECIARIRPGLDIMTARDLRPHLADGRLADVASHPVRSTVALFIAETLTVVTSEGDSDTALWLLITQTAAAVADGTATTLANIPAAFLLRLATILGIEPDHGLYIPGHGLDLTDGIFRPTRPLHDNWADPEATRLLVRLIRLLDNSRDSRAPYRSADLLHLPRSVRKQLLDNIIRYYTLHHYPLDRLRSLAVLKTVFS